MSQPYSSNATDRIVEQSVRRQRAQVPVPRAASIVEPSTPTSQPANTLPEPKILSEPTHLADSRSTHSPIPPELELEKGTTIRLEHTVFKETKLDGADKDYNRDTFLEAAWLILKDYPEIKDKVIHEAQRRSVLRRQYGRTRAGLTMGQRAVQRG